MSANAVSKEYTNLIIVCCHSIYKGNGDSLSEPEWVLQPFQQSNPQTGKPGEQETFITHIVVGTQALEHDPQAMLILSGGKTTVESERSEAESYAIVLKRLNGDKYTDRVLKEEIATDSYQNLIFSILRFRQHTGRYPGHVTVITHAFKQRRFLDLHAPAIKWPGHSIRVQGINPPMTSKEISHTRDSEMERAYGEFQKDYYGVGKALGGKRKARHWKAERAEYAFASLEPSILGLLSWSGGNTGTELFPEKLPWEED
ncbi:hypothetical protein LTR37_007792 [Vermiconidia calcicola]|uniref:Uncharacterized protein n=1 Tax=Vermiconidia calcicola TaxID=1690605 RepID=A0ACC3NE52_9PEZI|nr:hypothetical protein LTR37_007792 [Vermiconidia calcicola]